MNLNGLPASLVYHIRVALDNKACINGKEWWESSRDISNNLQWRTVPADLNTYIELGNFE